MPFAYPFALAFAAAVIDVTLGYPGGLARRIGTPSRWMQVWFGIVRVVGARWSGRAALAAFLGPVVVGAAVVAAVLPQGPLGFAATAFLVSTLYGRQSLDARARAVARTWESDGAYEALAVAEPLGPDEAEPRIGLAVAAALAAGFADEVAAPTLFILIGGLPGAAFCRALAVAGRLCRERRETSALALAVAEAERWTLAPAARLGALFLWLAAPRSGGWRALAAPARSPGAPAEAAMLLALGRPPRDEPAYLRAALALFRRAAAAEMAALAALALLATLPI